MSENTQSKDTEAAELDIELDENGQARLKEVGGRKGPEPTRFGDWEMNGKCVDF
jgi:hypothetical protein